MILQILQLTKSTQAAWKNKAILPQISPQEGYSLSKSSDCNRTGNNTFFVRVCFQLWNSRKFLLEILSNKLLKWRQDKTRNVRGVYIIRLFFFAKSSFLLEVWKQQFWNLSLGFLGVGWGNGIAEEAKQVSFWKTGRLQEDQKDVQSWVQHLIK